MISGFFVSSNMTALDPGRVKCILRNWYVFAFSVFFNSGMMRRVETLQLKQKCHEKCHFDEIFATGYIASCHFDNFQGQWWKFLQNVSLSSLKRWTRLPSTINSVVVGDLTTHGARASGDIVSCLNTLRPRQNGRHFADDIFKCIFLNENVWIPIKISLKFVPKGPINDIPALVQIMAWRRPGDKPLSEPIMISLPTHICVTRP